MDTQTLIKEIKKHPELHDLITHLGDFKSSIEFEIERTHDLDDKSYLEKQLKTADKLIELTGLYNTTD